MSRELEPIARHYASRNWLSVELPGLGGGVHGKVFFVRGNAAPGGTAIKVFYHEEFFHRELLAYERLREAGVREVLGLAVPQLIRADGELLVLEMTVVERPYLLDFAGAYLDETAPLFDEEVWEMWEADKREKFGDRWPEVKAVLAALEDNYGIHMLDVNPGNVALTD
jgi:hypothetical protein